MRKRSPHAVGRTVPGTPPSVDRLRRFHAPTCFHARPTRVDGQRDFAAPTLPQPLSHVATRRDSSPFRGAKGWEEGCGVYATVYHDADTYVLHPPVRGGVPDAPRSRDRRAALDAPAQRDQPHSRHPRRVRLRLPPHVCNPAGTARAPFGLASPTPRGPVTTEPR